GVTAANVTNAYVNIQYVSGNAGGPNVFIGSAMDEMFEGGSAVDVMVGMAGDDQIWGYADGSSDAVSLDILCGGDGSDTLTDSPSGGASGASSLEGEGA